MGTRYRIRRVGAVDLEFTGELLAEQTTQRHGVDRWAEVRIYRTDTGKYVVEEAGVHVDDGDDVRSTVKVTTSPAEVRAALTKRGEPNDPARRGEVVEYLTNVALDALDEAAENDPNLDAATVEII